MRPHERELDEEIRGHLALSIKERIERGEDPRAARMAALRELGQALVTSEFEAAPLRQTLEHFCAAAA